MVTIGDCVVDHYIVPQEYKVISGQGSKTGWLGLKFKRKTPVTEFSMFPGGNALNTAVGFRRLGLKTSIITSLGLQKEADLIVDRVIGEKIDPSLIKRDKNDEVDKGIVFVTAGERTIVSYHCKKKYQFPGNFSTKWLYLTSLGAGFETVYKSVIAYKKKNNVKIVYNPGSRQLRDSIGQVRKMIGNVELVFVNLEEAQRIVGSNKKTLKFLLGKLHNLGALNAVITDGQKGAFASDGSNYYRLPIFPIKRVDATGAGDAFASGFTAAMSYGLPTEEALKWGSINAAREISLIGVQNGLLKKNQLVNILKRNKNYKARKF